jgi:Protein of unknown function (DUF3429)
MPPIAILLTLTGLLPFIFCGLSALGQDRETADRMLVVLIEYAALVLAFSGGVQWAQALLSAESTFTSRTLRLVLGAAPLAIGWAVLAALHWLPFWIALAVLIACFIALPLLERQTGQHASVPQHYVWLRWGFTAVAVAMLTTVLVLRVFRHTVVL